MLKSTFSKVFIGIYSGVLIAVICLAIFVRLNKVEAAGNCGNDAGGPGVRVECACGDTVVTDYTFSSNLICTGPGSIALAIGANNITIDGQNIINPSINHQIIFNTNGAGGYGIKSDDFNNITIKNLTFDNEAYGIYINPVGSVNGINILNNYLINNHNAITINNADTVIISANTIERADVVAMEFNASNNFSIVNNNFIENAHTILAAAMNNSTISNNQFLKNRFFSRISTTGNNTISDNTLTDNEYTHMIAFNELASNRITNTSTPISLDIDLFDFANRTACTDCTTSITTYPNENITDTSPLPPGNKITANFLASKNGSYSVKISTTDIAENTESRMYRFYIGPVATQDITYYLNDIIPTHGQSNDADSGSFLKTSSLSNSVFQCDYWIQGSIEEMPDFPFSSINSLTTNIWYIMQPVTPPGSENSGLFGLQRYGTRYTYDIAPKGIIFDLSFPIPWNTAYSQPTYNFPTVNWAMDYPWDWYNLMVKMETDGGNDGPNWKTETGSTSPSQITVNYSAPTSPLIKSISNADINIVSATQDASSDPLSTSFVLNGTGNIDIILDSFTQPFLNNATTIATDGLGATTTTVHVTGLSGMATVENPVDMQIVPPNNETLDVTIDTWQIGGANYRKWSEAGTGTNLNTNHIIGSLTPFTRYLVKVDSVDLNTYTADGSGEITFAYTGGYSTKIFEVVLPPASPLGGSIPAYEGTVGVSINNNQESTTSPSVTIYLTANSSNQMLISDNENFLGATWEPFAAEKSWTFDSALGVKTIYVKFRNSFGLDSAVISDSINLVPEETSEVPAVSPVICQASLPLNIKIGDLLKVADSKTVYIVGLDNCRYTFPNEPTYFTWFADFSAVKTISVEIISQINMGKNVTVRPGTALVKIQSEPKVYMVEPGAKLISLDSAAVAVTLFGANWPSLVIDIPDVFFTDYQIAEPITGYADGTIIQHQNDANIYYLENGNKKLINAEIFNKLFQAKYLLRNISRTFDYPNGLNFPNTIIADIMTWK